LPRFNLDDYVEVKDRIAKFWDDHPQGAIETTMLYVDDVVVRFRAEVYFNSPHAATSPNGTGHAEEYRVTEEEVMEDWKKKNDPNYTSAVENCETSAVGRALANCGYMVSKAVASRQEMEKVKRTLEGHKESSTNGLDKSEKPAKVETTEAESGKLSHDEAVKLAGRIKATGIEIPVVKLKLVGMGVEEQKTLSQTLKTMTRDEALDLYSWVTGQTSDEGSTATA
jgi:hypothetical protein